MQGEWSAGREKKIEEQEGEQGGGEKREEVLKLLDPRPRKPTRRDKAIRVVVFLCRVG